MRTSPPARAPRLRRAGAALALALALALTASGCALSPRNPQEVNVESAQVTERDLEVARQMQAPEQVIQSLEQGEWLYPSDREAVRFAELALDHMQDAYGQECRATWSTVPWVLDTNATVTLVVVDGPYDGAEVEVTISAAEPHTYTDTWGQLALQDGYHDLVADALNTALADLPDGSWTFDATLSAKGAAPDAELSQLENAYGHIDLFLLSSVVPDEARLEELRVAALLELEKTGVSTLVKLSVLSNEAAAAPLTVAQSWEAIDTGAVTMTATGQA